MPTFAFAGPIVSNSLPHNLWQKMETHLFAGASIQLVVY